MQRALEVHCTFEYYFLRFAPRGGFPPLDTPFRGQSARFARYQSGPALLGYRVQRRSYAALSESRGSPFGGQWGRHDPKPYVDVPVVWVEPEAVGTAHEPGIIEERATAHHTVNIIPSI